MFAWTLQHEGIRGMFRGIGARMAISGPMSAITFAGYELAKRLSRVSKPEDPATDGDRNGGASSGTGTGGSGHE